MTDLLGIFFSLLAFFLYALAIVLMKYGITGLANIKEVKSDSKYKWHFTIWAVGSFFNFAYLGVVTLALAFTTLSLVGAMTGFIQIFVIFFSFWVLKERISPHEWIALAILSIGVGISGYFRPDLGFLSLSISEFYSLFHIVSFFLILIIAFIGKQVRENWKAFAFGLGSGICGGLAFINQKYIGHLIDNSLATKSPLLQVLGELITFIPFYGFLIVAVTSFIFVQMANHFGSVTRQTLPAMLLGVSSTSLTAGVVIFDELLSFGRIMGIILIILGFLWVFLLNQTKETKA